MTSDRDTLLSVLRELIAFARATDEAAHDEVSLEPYVEPAVVTRARAVLARAETEPLNPDGCATTGGTPTEKPLSEIAAMAVDLGDPTLSSTFRKKRGAAGEAGAPEPCCMCKQIPDSPISSGNPAMTICRECWVRAGASGGQEMAAFDRAEFDELLREVVALREWKAAHEAAAFRAGEERPSGPSIEHFNAALREMRAKFDGSENPPLAPHDLHRWVSWLTEVEWHLNRVAAGTEGSEK